MSSIRDNLKKHPKALNAALAFRQLVSRSLDRKKIDKDVDMTIAPLEEAPADDAATALFLRAIMAGDHKSVIEIGSYDGARIITLKKSLPHIEAFGLDILANYQDLSERSGVSFDLYSEAFFDRDFDRPLMISRGTMSYYDPDELNRLFDALARRRIAVAFYEPSPFFHVERSTVRYRKQNRIARYHPYDDMLEARGYTLSVDKRVTYNWARSLYGLECLRFQYATP